MRRACLVGVVFTVGAFATMASAATFQPVVSDGDASLIWAARSTIHTQVGDILVQIGSLVPLESSNRDLVVPVECLGGFVVRLLQKTEDDLNAAALSVAVASSMKHPDDETNASAAAGGMVRNALGALAVDRVTNNEIMGSCSESAMVQQRGQAANIAFDGARVSLLPAARKLGVVPGE